MIACTACDGERYVYVQELGMHGRLKYVPCNRCDGSGLSLLCSSCESILTDAELRGETGRCDACGEPTEPDMQAPLAASLAYARDKGKLPRRAGGE